VQGDGFFWRFDRWNALDHVPIHEVPTSSDGGPLLFLFLPAVRYLWPLIKSNNFSSVDVALALLSLMTFQFP